MFEEQVRLLRDKLMSMNKISLSSSSSSPNNNNDASQITDLQLRLSERDAALKVLRDEIRSLQQNKNESKAKTSVLLNSMTSIEALDLGVLEIRVSRSEAERKSMELQMNASQFEIDGLREENERLQELLDECKANNSKQKQKTRAVARVAVKKQKSIKEEVLRLRDQLNILKKEWTSPIEYKKVKSSLDKLKNKNRSLNNELLSRRKSYKTELKENSPTTATIDERSLSSSLSLKEELMESQEKMKQLKLKMKKILIEQKRKDVSMRELRVAYNSEIKNKKNVEEEMMELRNKMSDNNKSHQQRKAAIDAMREGVSAQRKRNELLQHKVKENSQLEQKIHHLEVEKNR
jgi:hypothetical protein